MPSARVLLRATDLTVGEFRCPPDDPAWRDENNVGEGHHVVFPQLPVGIDQDGRRPAVADVNQIVLYEHGQSYRRRLLDDDGDRCFYLIPSPALLHELAAAEGFPAPVAPIDPAAYLLQHQAIRALRDRGAEPDHVREILYEVLRRAFSWTSICAPSRRPATERSHEEAAEAIRLFLATNSARRVRLEDVGRHVHRSPFEAARIFRARTGTSIHGYLTQLRLRSALIRLGDAADLSVVAHEAGFASHAHLTDSFTKTFGLPPSRLRRADAAELRTIVEAALAASS
jgi:AraC-like DNA-binding protein